MASHWLAIASRQPPNCSSLSAGSALELLKQGGQLLVGITFSQLLHSMLHLLEQLAIAIRLAMRPKQSLDGFGQDGLIRIVLMHDHGGPNDAAQAAFAS